LIKDKNSIDTIVTDIFFNEIFNTIHEAILVVDIESKVIFVNKSYCRLFHVNLHKIVGRLMSTIEPDATVIQVIKTGQSVLGRLFKVDSANAFVISNAMPLIRDGILMGAVAVIRDITEVIELTSVLKHVTNITNLPNQETNETDFDTCEIMGTHPLMKQTLRLSGKVAKTEVNVLIRGETGTGKELFARAIHANSKRSDSAFVAINCASIPESLFESELFGYERGAFSGASPQGKPGKFELANNGTLFLDEVGELSPPLQAKLLRVIETREVDKIGGKKPLKINTRIISATNRDLQTEIKNNTFRSDLYHRIATITIELPPLRYRRDDIILLANHFLSKISEKSERKYAFSIDAYKRLLEYGWPGNVRELQNVITGACVASDDDIINLSELPINNEKEQHEPATPDVTDISSVLDYKSYMEFHEKALIKKTLTLTKGNKTEALELLKMNRKTFYDRLKRYGIINL